MRSYYKPGSWNTICDRCGFEHKSDLLRSEWTGLMVCGSCYETRHPQDLLRVPKEEVTPPWTRPEPADVFVDVPEVLTTEASDWMYTEAGIILQTEG
jgi:hypothetical protein